MQSPDPYAPPASDVSGRTLHDELDGEGPWRHGRMLVFRKDTELPSICVKSGERAEARLERRLSWHHPAWYAVILFNLIAYVIVALCVRKTARIRIGLTREWVRKRRVRIAIAFGAFSLSLLAILVGVGEAGGVEGSGWAALIPLGSFGMIGAIFYAFMAPRLVTPRRITKEYVWLGGVSRRMLDDLPEWPHGMREPQRAA